MAAELPEPRMTSISPGTASPSPPRDSLPDFDEILQTARSNLAEATPALPINFRFVWQQMGCVARVDKTDKGLRLRLVGDLGPVPFSAESPDTRDRLLELARWSTRSAGCRFTVSPRRHLNLLGELPVTEPLTGAAILSAAVHFLVDARPYVTLAREVRGAAAPVTGTGA